MSFAAETALIVDDDEFFRMALRTVVTGTLGFSEVLEAENFDQASATASPTCALSWPPSQIGAKTSCWRSKLG